MIRFRHGFAFHMEISFMETITRRMLSDIDSKVAENVSPSVALPGSNKERTRKKCQQLITRIEDIPTNVRFFSIYVLMQPWATAQLAVLFCVPSIK